MRQVACPASDAAAGMSVRTNLLTLKRSVLHAFSPFLLTARLCYSFSSYSHAVDEACWVSLQNSCEYLKLLFYYGHNNRLDVQNPLTVSPGDASKTHCYFIPK